MTVEGFLVTCAEDVVGEGATLKPALDQLNGVLATLDNRKAEIQQSIKGLNSYAMSFGEVLSGGPSSRPTSPISFQANSFSHLSTPHSPTSGWTPTSCCRRNAPTRRRVSREPRLFRRPTRAPGRLANRG